ncbi:MarR family transcriptional regulator [Pseudoclavibacter chungangensis]|uniref:MarR family transcriptional regulator n=1 Tax=Pseudoclavibacter chungangensis TaxID=587635 RepID=A0A7J5BPB3_9MICO|nr:MarR family transcriptional regulator [Pseudoclavibacter chungangensis]KAB1654529.1 MarR family transcriptional regulator [Pseudoclavibacter chungangensis]NYJ68245.1 DNA-binding MarR family transcriptional regulator [Pseudoclavibacter chungangensis]
MPSRTPEGDALTALVLPAFELGGEFLAAAERITAGHELTPALWQVLGAVLDEPLPVAEIARRVGLGLARQSVQRSANLLVERGWARWSDNPRHRRAKLLAPTDAGLAALHDFRARQHTWADAVGAEVGLDDLRELDRLLRLVAAASRRVRGEDDADVADAEVPPHP